MITLTEEQAQKIEEALAIAHSEAQTGADEERYMDALDVIRAAKSKEFTGEQVAKYAAAFDEAFSKAGLPQNPSEQERGHIREVLVMCLATAIATHMTVLRQNECIATAEYIFDNYISQRPVVAQYTAPPTEPVFEARNAFWKVALGNNTKLANLAKAAIFEAEKYPITEKTK